MKNTCDENYPVNGVVPYATHENLRAQSNVDKHRYFTICVLLIVLLFISTVLLAFSSSLTMYYRAQFEKAIDTVSEAPRSGMPSDIYYE